MNDINKKLISIEAYRLSEYVDAERAKIAELTTQLAALVAENAALKQVSL